MIITSNMQTSLSYSSLFSFFALLGAAPAWSFSNSLLGFAFVLAAYKFAVEPADAVALRAVALGAFIFKVKAAAWALHLLMGTIAAPSAHVKLCHGTNTEPDVAFLLYKLNFFWFLFVMCKAALPLNMIK
ncbi:MAG TPA: hypothetical protein VI934_04285 [Candidatus Nanoarchaeia archaeon]|nr:hypothetical protein [Candidatus Nanoarchaeia archaeon]